MRKEELKEISTSIWDKVRDAIDKGDKEKAKALLEEALQNVMQLRGILMDFIDELQIALAERAGEEAIHETMRKICNARMMPLFGQKFPRLTTEERIKDRSFAWAVRHGVNFEVEEDEEKFVFQLPCDTGGYLAAKPASGRTKKAYPWTSGEKDVSYYCAHCSLAAEVMAIEQVGYPFWINFPPKKAGELCIQWHYKDVQKAPEKFYKRAGKSKAKGVKS
jgi:hypothetical protein